MIDSTNKILLRVLLLSVFLLCLSTLSSGAEKRNRVLRFSTSSGLSSGCVNSVFQDSRGFLWISTDDGLNRYDGQNFMTFHYDFANDSTLSGNFVFSTVEDGDGNIWAATSKGITLINVEQGMFRRFTDTINGQKTVPDEKFSAFYLFKSGDLWIKSENSISFFNKESQSFENYKDPFASTKDYLSSSMTGDSDSTLLFANSSSIVRFYTGSRKFEVVCRLSKYNLFGKVFCIVPCMDSYLFGSENGLFVLNANGKLTAATSSAASENRAILSLLVDENNVVWMGTKRGLEVYDYKTNRHHLFNSSKTGQPLITESISSIEKDYSGILWLGTQTDGLIKLLAVNPHFSIFPDEESPTSLNSHNFTSIYTADDKNFWLGTMGEGLYHVNIKTGKTENIVIDENSYRVHNDIVFAISKGNGCLWLGTNSGVYRLDSVTGNVTKPGGELPGEDIRSLLDDGKGGLWIGAASGLYSYNGKKSRLIYRSPDEINAIISDSENRIWIGSRAGLYYLNQNSSELQWLTDSSGRNIDREILSLNKDHAGNIWVGCRAGLMKVSHSDSAGFQTEWEKGFTNEAVSSVISDSNDRIWFTTGREINYTGKNKTVPAINIYDGYTGHSFNRASAFCSPSGILYFGSSGGLHILNPDSLKYNPHLPKTALTGIVSCVKGECEPLYLDSNNTLNIKYGFNRTVEISFAALEYTAPAKNRYRVIIENYDETWRPETGNNTILLSGLLPGRYILKVKASNNDLIWSSDELQIPITVKAPIWLTGYAVVLYILILIFILQLIINTRISRYKKITQTLNAKEKAHTLLEAQQIQLRIANQNLTDSINYAARIQSAVIPSERKLTSIFPQSFVYFRPRDLVSGDFYWVSNSGSKAFLAAVDCTGHGVPGAFLSMIGMNLLRSIIEGAKEENPARILEMLSLELEKTFGNGDTEDTIKDGMDLALCVVDRNSSTLEFAGAVNELYLIRNQELITCKADRNPIGRSMDGLPPHYTSHTIEIQPNDVFYVFSDGYADQFGGTEMKKFKYRRFRYLLLSIHRQSPQKQKESLNQAFEEWRGQNEQVDDVLVMGFCPIKDDNF